MDLSIFNTTSFIPFTESWQVVGDQVYIACSLVAFVLNVCAVYHIFKKPLASHVILLGSLLVSNCIHTLFDLSLTVSHLVHRGFDGGLPVCLFTYYFSNVMAYVTVMGVAGISFVRYCSISWGRSITISESIILVVVIWSTALVLTALPFMAHDHLSSLYLPASLTMCVINYRNPAGLPYKTFMISFGFSFVSLITYLYYSMFQAVAENTRIIKQMSLQKPSREFESQTHTDVQDPQSDSLNSSPKLNRSQDKIPKTYKGGAANKPLALEDKAARMEQIMFRQGLAIIVSYVACWGTVMVVYFVSYFTLPPPEVDLLYFYFISLNCIIDAAIVLFLLP
ncbi:hypothetical protein HDV03_003755 [Kappamyces sp. JEL0829]|nr:hypothetical protein HDV03_003755 [Kappamyces sp. JEL0829]